MILTSMCLALVCWVLFANRKVAVKDDGQDENKTTGHVYDGIEEYDNPLPRWWFMLFVGTLIFAAIYLVIYPGFGAYKGVIGWTSVKQLEAEQEAAREDHTKTYGVYSSMPVEELIHDGRAMKMGVRLFANNCSVCHGADGGGNFGFPNLTDKDWLYGGSPEEIQASITHGRSGAMPAWGEILGEEKVVAVAEYVMSLSGMDHDADLAEQGAGQFQSTCAACHGPDGKGQKLVGAPNLTDSIWLYEGSREAIQQAIRSGRKNQMPAQENKLREEKIHLLTAYVYSLSYDYDK
ncbi:cytochrome c oxidase, Cbb3-type, subunit III [Teredinibacter turnerae T7901]|uniref:Cbb3-type cytochrome c oxidase subunit n=2 Tax=Teredinibacter turnerae TaxID=2426 RepID=C5BNJ8_TERTT|nr:cytochrome-c oxidase, cbb3-type subunit III [Teredinibacter turnerae]ACR11634.1 cytochrome c oxidase, Cbb3-type, subunit III [Teredinibacter turnerae T7901]